MTFPVKEPFKISSGFDDIRPLSAVRAIDESNDHDEIKRITQSLHKHGAIDIPGTEIPIYAPEDCDVYYHVVQDMGKWTGNNVYWPSGRWYAFSNYRYSIWGCMIIAIGKEYTHVFAHVDRNEIFKILKCSYNFFEHIGENGSVLSWINLEDPRKAKEGEKIGVSGNSGFSTGPHIHYEIHRGKDWTAHGKRPRPEEVYGEEIFT